MVGTLCSELVEERPPKCAFQIPSFGGPDPWVSYPQISFDNAAVCEADSPISALQKDRNSGPPVGRDPHRCGFARQEDRDIAQQLGPLLYREDAAERRFRGGGHRRRPDPS